MMRLRTFIILLIIYVISYLAITLKINLLYPYYFIKDIITYPVHAITKNENICLSSDLEMGINSSLNDEITNLKKLLNIKTVLSEFNYINATVIERNREYWFNTLKIDKGKKDGVKLDDAVISSDGLIGRISAISEYTSDIKLITTNDTNNKISVVIKDDSDIYGITNGFDGEYLKVIVNNKEDLKGMVYTTGMGGIFPSGILIGEVYKVSKAMDDVTTIVLVKLASNIEGERYVSVLQRKILDS